MLFRLRLRFRMHFLVCFRVLFLNQPTHLGNNDENCENNRYDRLSEQVNSPAIIIQIEDKIEDPTDKIILKTMLKFTRVSFKIMICS